MGYPRTQYTGHQAQWQDLETVFPSAGQQSVPEKGQRFPQFYQPTPVFVPLWVPAYPVADCFQPHQSFHWFPAPMAPAHRRTNITVDAAKGTGVFLPAVPSETESHSEASQGAKKDLGSSGSEMDTDSDIDSADSASDCIMLPTTLKRGRVNSNIPIEQLLPDEWEY